MDEVMSVLAAAGPEVATEAVGAVTTEHTFGVVMDGAAGEVVGVIAAAEYCGVMLPVALSPVMEAALAADGQVVDVHEVLLGEEVV